MMYRKKPVVIEAYLWPGGYGQAGEPAWFKAAMADGDVELVEGALFITTLEGVMEARPGDYIIKGIRGEFYPCKPDIFEATYDPVEPGGEGEK